MEEAAETAIEDLLSIIPIVVAVTVILGVFAIFFGRRGEGSETEEDGTELPVDPFDTQVKLIEEAKRGHKMKIG